MIWSVYYAVAQMIRSVCAMRSLLVATLIFASAEAYTTDFARVLSEKILQSYRSVAEREYLDNECSSRNL